MYTVVGSPKTRAFRVVWMLEELGLKYDLTPDYPHGDEISKLNPSGKVPVLLDDGEPIIDSVAIIQYLADKHGQFTYAAGTIERARQDSLLHFINDEIDGCLWTAARHSFILPKERRVPEVKDALKWEFARSIKTLEKRLGDNEFLMGDKMTVPDIVLAHSGGWARNSGFEVGDGPIRAYFKRMIARDGYKRAHKIRAAS